MGQKDRVVHADAPSGLLACASSDVVAEIADQFNFTSASNPFSH